MATPLRYHRIDIVEAASKKFGIKMSRIALEEVNGEFRVRSMAGPTEEHVSIDGVHHIYEKNVKTYAGPWKTLAEAAAFFGVKKR